MVISQYWGWIPVAYIASYNKAKPASSHYVSSELNKRISLGGILSAAERRGTPVLLSEMRGTPVLLSASLSNNSGNSPQMAAPRRCVK